MKWHWLIRNCSVQKECHDWRRELFSDGTPHKLCSWTQIIRRTFQWRLHFQGNFSKEKNYSTQKETTTIIDKELSSEMWKPQIWDAIMNETNYCAVLTRICTTCYEIEQMATSRTECMYEFVHFVWSADRKTAIISLLLYTYISVTDRQSSQTCRHEQNYSTLYAQTPYSEVLKTAFVSMRPFLFLFSFCLLIILSLLRWFLLPPPSYFSNTTSPACWRFRLFLELPVIFCQMTFLSALFSDAVNW